MLDRIKRFLEESRREFQHVNWPTRAEAARLTGVVIFLSIAIAAFLGAFDALFTSAIHSFVLR
jgi:preprotein translocase SecE subunit